MKINSKSNMGATYRVIVRETLQRVLEIEAPSAEMAVETVKGLYQQEMVVLDYADFVEAEISIMLSSKK